MIALLWVALGVAGELEDAAAEAEAYPQDYAAVSGWARVAAGAGEWGQAARAWAQAAELSGWGLEAGVGLVDARLGAGDRSGAREAARHLVELHPDDPWAHLADARARAATGKGGAPEWAALRARSAVRRAVELAPDLVAAQCSRAWSRAAVGDGVGMSRALARAGDCPRPELQLAPYGGGAYATWMTYTHHPVWTGGPSLYASVWTRPTDGTLLEVVGQAQYIGGRTGSAGGGASHTEFFQGSLWLRGGVSRGDRGAQILTGGVFSDDDSSGGVLAASGWITRGATLSVELAGGVWSDDAWSLQAGVGLRVPLWRAVALRTGVQHTSLLDDGGVDHGLSGSCGLDITLPSGLELVGTARVGREARPVRLDEATVWNTEELLGPSADLTLTVPAGPVSVSLGWEGARLIPLMDPPLVAPPPTLQTLTLGLSTTGGTP